MAGMRRDKADTDAVLPVEENTRSGDLKTQVLKTRLCHIKVRSETARKHSRSQRSAFDELHLPLSQQILHPAAVSSDLPNWHCSQSTEKHHPFFEGQVQSAVAVAVYLHIL
jgi:hypothetical protein